jgi:hypothetical protein
MAKGGEEGSWSTEDSQSAFCLNKKMIFIVPVFFLSTVWLFFASADRQG